MKSKREIALEFEQMIIDGDINAAYEKFVSPDFRHHSPFFKGDRESLMAAMKENADRFPNKDYQVVRSLEDGDLVATHARLKLKPEMPDVSIVHIYRFKGDKIVEEWDMTQTDPKDSLNENGLF